VHTDERLSLAAMGLLSWLHSCPPGWKIIPTYLQKRFNIGPDKTYAVINELRAYGWITREAIRKGGRFVQWGYTVHASPLPEIPELVATIPGKTSSGKSGRLLKTERDREGLTRKAEGGREGTELGDWGSTCAKRILVDPEGYVLDEEDVEFDDFDRRVM